MRRVKVIEGLASPLTAGSRWWSAAARRSWLAAVPGVLAVALAVLPSAEAGALPMPVRRPPAGAVLHAVGPPATAYPYHVGIAPALDASGFVIGQCTSFVAWWLNARGLPFGVVTVGPGGTAWFLNASSWDVAARAAGYRVGSRPVVGAIAEWHAGETSWNEDDQGIWGELTAGGSGHVAIVVRVLPDGQAEWLDYGAGGHAQLHRGVGFAPRYLYLGVDPG